MIKRNDIVKSRALEEYFELNNMSQKEIDILSEEDVENIKKTFSYLLIELQERVEKFIIDLFEDAKESTS